MDEDRGFGVARLQALTSWPFFIEKKDGCNVFIALWFVKQNLFTQVRAAVRSFFYGAAPLRAASEALSPVGAAAADGSAASWLAVAVRAEVLEGCCYVSPPSSLPASLSLSLSLPDRASLWSSCVVLPLLALTWMSAVLAITDRRSTLFQVMYITTPAHAHIV